jgi:hypothetical protein
MSCSRAGVRFPVVIQLASAPHIVMDCFRIAVIRSESARTSRLGRVSGRSHFRGLATICSCGRYVRCIELIENDLTLPCGWIICSITFIYKIVSLPDRRHN